MICPKCGKEYPDDVTACPSCEEELQASVPAPTEPVAASGRTPRRWGPFVACVAILIAVLVCVAYYLFTKTAPLSAMLPEKSPLVIALDANWAWNAIEDVRKDPDAGKSIAEAEKEMGLSIDKDIMPWIGQIAIVPTEIGPMGPPKVAFFVQVSNWPKLLQSEKKLQQMTEKSAGSKWTNYSYKGVTLSKLEMGAGQPAVAAGRVGGWFVVGMGADVVEKIIDVSQGRATSLAKNAAWSKALAKMPKKPVFWYGMDMAEYLAMFRKLSPMSAMMPPSVMEMSNSVAVIALTEKPDELRLDGFSVANSDKVRQMMKDLKGDMKPVSDKAFKQLPEGTVLALMMSSPGKLWEKYKAMLLDMSQTPEQRRQMEAGFKQGEAIEKALNRLTGQCALGLVWSDKTGFGLSLVGETDSSSNAQSASADVARFMTEVGLRMEHKGDVYSIPSVAAHEEFFSGTPAWGSRSEWFVFATKPEWVRGGVMNSMAFPSELNGVDSGVVADFKFLDSVLAKAEKSVPASGKEEMAVVRGMGMDKAKLLGWGSTDPNGEWSQSTMVLNNWEWRKAIKGVLMLGKETQRAMQVPRAAPHP